MITYDASYNAFEEFMHYFQFEYNIYILLMLIVAINCTKVIVQMALFMRSQRVLENRGFELVTSGLACLGLMQALFVQGVIADISDSIGRLWSVKVLGIMICTFGLYFLQMFLAYMEKRWNEKKAI